MRTLIIATTTLLIALIFLSSCSTKNEVVSGGIITKRKYRKGYCVQLPSFLEKQKESYTLSKEENINTDETVKETLFIASSEKKSDITDAKIIAEVKPGSKFSETIQGVKNLYSRDITDLRTFRTEYKAIKVNYKNRFLLNTVSKERQEGEEKGKAALSIVSFMCAIVGILAVGLILGTLAVIFGIIALAKKKKAAGLAICGIILGVADVVLVLIYLSTL